MAERLVVKIRKPRNVDVVFVVHLYYVGMLNDLAGHLEKLRQELDFEVVVTIPEEHEYKRLVDTIADKLDAYLVVSMDNKGKDVLPFLIMLKHIKGFRYGCKIHTKNTFPTTGLGVNPDNPYETWRDDLWHSLMDAEQAKRALVELESCKFYAPEHLWLNDISDSKHFSVTNKRNQKKLGELVGVDLFPRPFVAGTMFWFRVASLTWLHGFKWEDYFESYESNDGQMEHAFERSFAQLAI
jgi:lipopolysaccharide biosynthesis protein